MIVSATGIALSLVIFAAPRSEGGRTEILSAEPCGSFATPAPDRRRSAVHHYEYVVPDGNICVYDIDHGLKLVREFSLPQAKGVRGIAADVAKSVLYISYGGDGGANGNGSLLRFNLVRGKVVWTRSYDSGVDSMAMSGGGRKIFMPTGELSAEGTWNVLDAQSGRIVGEIHGGAGPHNTIVGLRGTTVYLGGRNSNYLALASTRTYHLIRRVGPLKSGVRPFTVNGKETIAYTTATGFLGFEVSDLRRGRRLYTIPIQGFTWDPREFLPSAPSHGISLSPDESELYVMDAPNSYVHVFDVRGVPARPPRKVADIKIRDMAGTESPCAYDCARDGWLQHSRDGRFVFVGDSGDVISTTTRRIVSNLPSLRNSRKSLEIDWKNGRPVGTTSRYGLGYVRRSRASATR